MKLLTNTLKKTDGPTRSGTAAAALAALLQVGGMVGGMGAISTLAGWPGQARAEAPAAKTQVAGYYRQQVGGFEVTALNDGTVSLDLKLYHGLPPARLQQMVDRQFRSNPVATSVSGYLVNTGSKLVLVDTGTANLFGPTLGRLMDNLKAAGYTPEQVDVILITHFHGDHVGGLVTADGKPAFPNATVHADQAESDFWLSAEQAAKAPEGAKPFFKMAQASLKPYVDAGRFKPFKGATELLPGVKALPTPKHTPGHTSYLFESQGERLLAMGDLVHNVSVQFEHPEVSIDFDADQPQAIAQRKKVFTWAAKDKLLVAGAHLPFPGLGHIRADGRNRFAWVPVDFQPVLK